MSSDDKWLEEFIGRLNHSLSIIKNGNTYLVASEDALAFGNAALNEGAVILGFEGFIYNESELIPQMDAIGDFGTGATSLDQFSKTISEVVSTSKANYYEFVFKFSRKPLERWGFKKMSPQKLMKKYPYLKKYNGHAVDYLLDGSNILSRGEILKEIYLSLGFDDFIPYANYNGLDDLLFVGGLGGYSENKHTHKKYKCTFDGEYQKRNVTTIPSVWVYR